MTSAEKLAHLRQLAQLMVVRREGPRIMGTLVTIWTLVPGRMRRSLIGDLTAGLADPNDADGIDEILDLVAGVALELRSDDRPQRNETELREVGRDLLDRVLPAPA